MLMVITGNGKGKTTAAIGQTIRAVGTGTRVFFAQFIKSDSYPSGEDVFLRSVGRMVRFVKGGRGFVGILGDTTPVSVHRAAAKKTLAQARAAVKSKRYGLIVLDEINVALSLRLLTFSEVRSFLRAALPSSDVVLTGRNADARLIALADYVTECLEVKHPYQKNARAQKGIEY